MDGPWLMLDRSSLAPASPWREKRFVRFSSARLVSLILTSPTRTHVRQNQTVVVVEPPLNYKLVFDGPTNFTADGAKPVVSPASVALFPHVHGASVCAPLYDHYVAEDGLCYHL